MYVISRDITEHGKHKKNILGNALATVRRVGGLQKESPESSAS
jgi:hypothetical protein